MTTKPSPGDRLTQPDGTVHIRVHRMYYDDDGLPIGRLTVSGRARYEWLPLSAIEPWDEYLLTAGEIRALRYMQRRAKEAA
jgi:hypothetical protein